LVMPLALIFVALYAEMLFEILSWGVPVLVLIGLWFYESSWVKAGQSVPLS